MKISLKIKSFMSAAFIALLVVSTVGNVATAQGSPAQGSNMVFVPQDFDLRHKFCLEQIAKDADLAYEEAMIWQSEGGGRRARHCVAMALFGLGHVDEAAFRISKLAKDTKTGPIKMRMDYYAQGVDLWLEADVAQEALNLATHGLALKPSDIELRIERARAYAALGRWDYAEIDLTSALGFNPYHINALRYRADARLRQGDLLQARADIDRAVALDAENIDILLVRGKIKEAQRLKRNASKP